MATWNIDFEASPENADPPSEGAEKIRELKIEVADRGNKEHTWAGATAVDGVHKKGSARVYFTTATPTLQPDAATALATATDAGRLYWRTNSKSSTGALSSGHALFIYSGGSTWHSVAVNLSNAQSIYGIKTFKSTTVLSGGMTFSNGPVIKYKVMSIGDWNMDTTAGVEVAHGLTRSKIIGVETWIRADTGSYDQSIDYVGLSGGYVMVDDTVVKMTRIAGGQFDNTTFNATSFNRGWVTIRYIT